MTSIEVPTSFLNNLDIIISHQNIKLIKEICKWKGWDASELIEEFMGKDNKAKISKTRIRKEKIGNNQNRNDSHNNSDELNLNSLEIRYRNICVINGNRYYIESPTDNIYSMDGDFLGKKSGESIDYDAEED